MMNMVKRKRRLLILGGTLASLAVAVLLLVRRLSPVPIVVDPPFQLATAAEWLRGDDLVLGVFLDGVAKAYPIPAVAPLEYLNDRVGGRPIGVSW